LGLHDSRLHFRPHKVYFFELSIKFLIDGWVTRLIKKFMTNKSRFWAPKASN
jgi:hypothetical protein